MTGTVAERSRRTRLAGSVRSYLRANWQDIVILVALVALTVLVRILNLEGIGTGGDAIRKWFFAKQWHYANDFGHGAKWDHHMARFGVVGVAYLVQTLFGRGPSSYYIPPLFAAVLETVFVYACGKRLAGRWTGIVAAVFVIYFKGQIRAASQLMPEVFSGAYSIVAAYLFLRYAAAEGAAKTRWLVATSAMIFVAYLAKETSLFYAPGFALGVWLVRTGRRQCIRDLAILAGVCILGALIETGFYRIFTDYPHRLAIVDSNHLPDESNVRGFWKMLDRYEQSDGPWRFAFYLFIPSLIGVLLFSGDTLVASLCGMVAIYYVFLTFLPRTIRPWEVWQSFRARYLDPTAPFVFLVMSLFLTLGVRAALARRAESRWTRAASFVNRHAAAFTVALVLLTGSISYAVEYPHLDNNAFRLNARMAKIANDAYSRNLPMVGKRDPRGLWTVYNVLLDDEQLARRRELPLWEDVQYKEGGKIYLIRNPKAYRGGKLRKLIQAGCVIEVSAHAGLAIKMKPLQRLDSDCDDILKN